MVPQGLGGGGGNRLLCGSPLRRCQWSMSENLIIPLRGRAQRLYFHQGWVRHLLWLTVSHKPWWGAGANMQWKAGIQGCQGEVSDSLAENG